MSILWYKSNGITGFVRLFPVPRPGLCGRTDGPDLDVRVHSLTNHSGPEATSAHSEPELDRPTGGASRPIAASALSPFLREAYSLWLDLAAGAPLPDKRGIDPTRMPRHLSTLALLDVIQDQDGLDFRLALVGQQVSELNHRDIRGQRVSTLPEVERDGTLMRLLRATVDQVVPQCGHVAYVGPSHPSFLGIDTVNLLTTPWGDGPARPDQAPGPVVRVLVFCEYVDGAGNPCCQLASGLGGSF